jgi:hypothetical protein
VPIPRGEARSARFPLLSRRASVAVNGAPANKTESLFLHGTTPWTPVGAVPDLARLVDWAARLLEAPDRPRPDRGRARHAERPSNPPLTMGRTGVRLTAPTATGRGQTPRR